MKYSKIMGLMLILTSVQTKAERSKPTVICHQGRAFVHAVTWDTGCTFPDTAFFKFLSLESDSAEGGKIEIQIGYTFGAKNPHCDNPRGMPHFFNLPLPVETGTWEIELVGQGKTLLTFAPNCNVQR